MTYDIKDYATVEVEENGQPIIWCWKTSVLIKYPRKDIIAMSKYFGERGIIVSVGMTTVLDIIDHVVELEAKLLKLEARLLKLEKLPSTIPSRSSFLSRLFRQKT